MKLIKLTRPLIGVIIALIVCLIGFIAGVGETSTNTYYLDIDTTYNLYVFKPTFSRIELKIGTMPSTDNDSIAFCGAAAFTESLSDTFIADNIIGGYIAGDNSHNTDTILPDYYGRFVSIGDCWQFVEIDNFSAIDNTLARCGSMFTQRWVIKNSEIYRPYTLKDSTEYHIYRALCEKNDRLMIAQSRKNIPYYIFARALKAYGIENALYMNMGSGWNHAFYRDSDNQLHILFPKKNKYCTNWITFYK